MRSVKRIGGVAAAIVCSITLGVGIAAAGTTGGAPSSSGRTISLDHGQVSIPAADVGSVNLRSLPLGDQQYSSSPQVGKIDLCNASQLQPANDSTALPWVHATTWDLTQKVFVSGRVAWPTATFTSTVQGSTRVLSGNDLPVGQTTGTFPVAQSDPASAYRPDPSSITADNYTLRLPANPKRASQPTCVGGDVGVTTDGVALLDGFDANGRDAGAQEVQDTCQGHPNNAGYHRHAMPLCLLSDSGTGHSPLLGYALDGYGIYGPRGDHGKVLSTADLDACHGITDTITWNGKKVRMYHYVLTWQFPYSVGCFRGTPVSRTVFPPTGSGASSQTGAGGQGRSGGPSSGGPTPGASRPPGS
jgi:hypothetical protein